MHLNLSADDVLTTTRSVRKRLDFDRPVEREVILECIDIAQQAPTGSNSQMWQWFVVSDPEKKKQIQDWYGEAFDPYVGSAPAVEWPEGDARGERQMAVTESATYLRENMHRAPYYVIPLQAGRIDGADTFGGASYWGSILPAAWSFMLALRERGLGTSWTTLHLPKEKETAELLGIPHDQWTQAGLFPVAYTKGTDFKPAKRNPAADLVHWDEW